MTKMKVWNSINDEYDYHVIEVKPEFLEILKILNIPDDYPNTSSSEISKKLNIPGRKTAGIISSMQYYKLIKFDGYCRKYTLYRITELGRENLCDLK